MIRAITTGHKSFDKQIFGTGVMTGNVWGDVQTSNYIRGRKIIDCNGMPFPEGHLQDFDLKLFQNLPHPVVTIVRGLAPETEPVILYEIHHWNGDEKVVHGYIVTRPDPRTNSSRGPVLWFTTTRRSAKSSAVIETIADALNQDAEEAKA